MRELLTRGVGVVGALVGAALLLAAPVMAIQGDTVADAVLGQPDFVTGGFAALVACHAPGGPSASTLCAPQDVAVDPATGRLFVADNGSGRVLSWPNTHRLQNGEPADLVLEQSGHPNGIGLDRDGRLYV